MLLQSCADPNAARRCMQQHTSSSYTSTPPFSSSCDGLTPLIFACCRDPPSLTDEADAVVSMVDITQAPLKCEHRAARDWAACVRALMQKRPKYSGANIHQRDDFKRTCLYDALFVSPAAN
jgi:hypothetical protein